jgi:hypothetical protein
VWKHVKITVKKRIAILKFSVFLYPLSIVFHITALQTNNMKQIMDATKNTVRDEISVENSRKSAGIPSGMKCKNEDTTCHPRRDFAGQ